MNGEKGVNELYVGGLGIGIPGGNAAWTSRCFIPSTESFAQHAHTIISLFLRKPSVDSISSVSSCPLLYTPLQKKDTQKILPILTPVLFQFSLNPILPTLHKLIKGISVLRLKTSDGVSELYFSTYRSSQHSSSPPTLYSLSQLDSKQALSLGLLLLHWLLLSSLLCQSLFFSPPAIPSS